MLKDVIASQFKKPAGLFGIFVSNLMKKQNQKHYNRIIRDLDVQPLDSILEIGYGPGLGIRMLAETCSTCTIHGIDFSQLMYKRAGMYNKPFIEAGRVQLQHGDFLKMPVIPDRYDKIFCLNVIYFWNELHTPFEKVFALLKEGGAFHMYMADSATLVKKRAPDRVFNKYAIEQVVEALNAAGFMTVEHYEEKGLYIKARK